MEIAANKNAALRRNDFNDFNFQIKHIICDDIVYKLQAAARTEHIVMYTFGQHKRIN